MNKLAGHPLTAGQMMLWAGQQLRPDSAQYATVFTFELRGPLVIEQLQWAFSRLVRESDAFRTVFRLLPSGEVRQYVLDKASKGIVVIDPERGRTNPQDLKEWVARESQQPFDLSRCSYRAKLRCVGPEYHVLYLNLHHLITDASSVAVLFRRLSALYDTGGAGAEKNRPVSFAEYRALEAESRGPSAYWREAALPPVPALYGRWPEQADSLAPRLTLDLVPEQLAGLDALTEHPEIRHWTRDLSLYNIFATLVFAHLYRIGGQGDLVIGTPAGNRSTARSQRLTGLLIEMLPLGVSVNPDDTFLTLYQRVRTATNAFLRNAQPGIITPRLAAGYNVVLNYINAKFGDLARDVATTTRWWSPGYVDPAHHLRYQIFDFGDGLKIELDLNRSVFSPEDDDRVRHHFAALLSAFVSDPHMPLTEIDLVKPAEEARLRTSGTGPQRDVAPDYILRGFLSWAERTPEAPALRMAERTVTYAELLRRSTLMAAFLQARCGTDGGVIALHLSRSPELLVAILACWRAGFTYLPIPAHTPAVRTQLLLRRSGTKLVVADRLTKEKLADAEWPIWLVDEDWPMAERHVATDLLPTSPDRSPAYIIFTSGSTGEPKGVVIEHAALANYIEHAARTYVNSAAATFPLFTSIGFDLTVTSLFTPLVCGGSLVIYPEPTEDAPDLSVFRVFADNLVDVVKLTPSHLALLRDRDFTTARVRTLIVGGENFRNELAKGIRKNFPSVLRIFNEYGPTEATVGSVVYELDSQAESSDGSVPIGKPLQNLAAYVLDGRGRWCPAGVPGELYLAGAGLAAGYLGQPELSEKSFVTVAGQRMYRTGDRVRLNEKNELEFLGRKDRQVKWRGFRIELNEVETALAGHPLIKDVSVMLVDTRKSGLNQAITYCKQCGLPSNYPSASYDEVGVCQICRGFEDYQERAKAYFRTMDDLAEVFANLASQQRGEYDCIMLLSGGKDSTYALARLVGMGLRVLAFTLDNGYISEQALANVRRVADTLGVDVVFGRTDAMNDIFVDSLHRHCNVCNGCFKTIYTLSTQLALEKGIPYIVTGLSRGQFFETRLSEEIFWSGERHQHNSIDEAILEARKIYHRADDAVKDLLDTSAFADDEVFERVKFLDFYRYCDATLEEMYAYLDQRLPWIRPTDTGRSTNCLINQLGIYVHKREKGYNNYAFPYSWDVRIGHKEREAALEEINEEIDEAEVKRMMREIGYAGAASDRDSRQLIAYYVGDAALTPQAVRDYLAERLPAHALPGHYVPLPNLPRTPNGKVDRETLLSLTDLKQTKLLAEYVAPEGELEELVAGIWQEVLQLDQVSTDAKFIDLGGHSLTAIRIAARISEVFELEMPLPIVFEKPTIAAQAAYLESTIGELLAEMDSSP